MSNIVLTFPHVSKGPTLVSWPSASYDLGYADDRVQIEERPFWEDIRNDAFGGAAGAPSDVHFLGAIAIVSVNLNRFQDSVMQNLADLDGLTGNTYGTYSEVGSFMRQDGMYGSLVLSNRTETLTYEVSFLRQGRRFNVGTRHTVFSLVFECHIDDPCDMSLFVKGAAADPCSST